MTGFKLIARPGRLLAILFPLLSVAACSAPRQSERVSLVNAAQEIKVVNYDAVPCDAIRSVNDSQALNGPLYWLHVMDCAARMSPADARAQARNWDQPNWQSAFKQGILLDNGNVTPLERRAYVNHLDDFMFDYPAAMRPLIQLWHDIQTAELQLAQERMRYAQLQQKNDGQLDALRRQLAQTQRKLSSLTDIERQLSSRRAAEGSDSGHNRNKSAPAVSDNPTGSRQEP